MKKAWIITFCCGFLFTTSTTYAFKVNSLYQAKIAVNTQSKTEEQNAEQLALAEVLIKITGNSHVLDNPQLKTALSTSEKLVQEFGYIKATDPSRPYLLEIAFDKQGVDHLLRSAAIPIWGQNRPLISSWIAFIDKNRPAEVLTDKTMNTLTALLKHHAELRGLPIVFPTMDTTDLSNVSLNDIITMTTPPLLEAAKRYRSDGILIGEVSQTPDGLQSQWKLLAGKDQWTFTITEKTANDIAAAIIDQITSALSTHYAVLTSNNIQKNIILKVMGINQHADFTQLVRYLHHLTPVVDVGIVRITGNEVLLSLSLRSTQQSFVQVIALGSKLTPINDIVDTSQLVYQWNE